MNLGSTPSERIRNPGERLGPECNHKSTEDCMICAICGRCREDLNSADICTDCSENDPTSTPDA